MVIGSPLGIPKVILGAIKHTTFGHRACTILKVPESLSSPPPYEIWKFSKFLHNIVANSGGKKTHFFEAAGKWIAGNSSEKSLEIEFQRFLFFRASHPFFLFLFFPFFFFLFRNIFIFLFFFYFIIFF